MRMKSDHLGLDGWSVTHLTTTDQPIDICMRQEALTSTDTRPSTMRDTSQEVSRLIALPGHRPATSHSFSIRIATSSHTPRACTDQDHRELGLTYGGHHVTEVIGGVARHVLCALHEFAGMLGEVFRQLQSLRSSAAHVETTRYAQYRATFWPLTMSSLMRYVLSLYFSLSRVDMQ